MIHGVKTEKIICLACGWKSNVARQGCVVFTPTQCVRCGSERLLLRPASVLERLNPVEWIRELLGK